MWILGVFVVFCFTGVCCGLGLGFCLVWSVGGLVVVVCYLRLGVVFGFVVGGWVLFVLLLDLC